MILMPLWRRKSCKRSCHLTVLSRAQWRARCLSKHARIELTRRPWICVHGQQSSRRSCLILTLRPHVPPVQSYTLVYTRAFLCIPCERATSEPMLLTSPRLGSNSLTRHLQNTLISLITPRKARSMHKHASWDTRDFAQLGISHAAPCFRERFPVFKAVGRLGDALDTPFGAGRFGFGVQDV